MPRGQGGGVVSRQGGHISSVDTRARHGFFWLTALNLKKPLIYFEGFAFLFLLLDVGVMGGVVSQQTKVVPFSPSLSRSARLATRKCYGHGHAA